MYAVLLLGHFLLQNRYRVATCEVVPLYNVEGYEPWPKWCQSDVALCLYTHVYVHAQYRDGTFWTEKNTAEFKYLYA